MTPDSPDLTQLLILHDQRKHKKVFREKDQEEFRELLKLQELDHKPQDQQCSAGEIQRGAGPEGTELGEEEYAAGGEEETKAGVERRQRRWSWRWRRLLSFSTVPLLFLPRIPPSRPPPSPAAHPLFSHPRLSPPSHLRWLW